MGTTWFDVVLASVDIVRALAWPATTVLCVWITTRNVVAAVKEVR